MARLERPDDVIFGTPRLTKPGRSGHIELRLPICATA